MALSLSLYLDSLRCRKNNQQFTFVNWEGPRVSKGHKRCPGSRYSLSIQCAGQWPFVAHMHTKIKISKISFNLSGAKSVLVIPRQVTMHTSQNQLGLDQGPVTAYSTLTSSSRHPWPSSESLDFNFVGVDHLPRLASAQNELVLRLANHGLVLLGHLFYGLAELHKLCPDRLRSSTRRTSDGLSEPLQAGCIGGHVHQKNIAKFFRTEIIGQAHL